MALDHHFLESASASVSAEATRAAEPSTRAWARRTIRELAVQDWLVLGYLLGLTFAVAIAEPAADRTYCLERSSALFAVAATCLVLVRGGLVRDRFFAPLGYRLAIFGTVQTSYFLLRRLLPVVNHGSLDAELLAIDAKWLHFEPAVWLDRFVTPATTEWFAFFYFGYFFLLAAHVLPFVLGSRRTKLLAEFSFGMLFVFSVAHTLYMFVPGYGPYHYLAGHFEHELPSGTWMNAVWSAVSSGGAQKDIFPSLHTAAPTFIAIFSFRHRDEVPFKYSWPLTAFFAANIVVATMFLRWHYLIDVVAGLVLANVGALVAARVARSEDVRRAAEGLSPVWNTFFARTGAAPDRR
jgi:membrane-associated phospholipid phosphatase